MRWRPVVYTVNNVPEVARFKKVLLSLADAELRHGWLRSQLQQSTVSEGARLLNAVLEQSEGAEPSAREVLLTIVLWVIRLDSEESKDQLRAEAEQQRLFSLGRLLRKAPPPPVHSPPPEQQPVPDYGTGRELTLGERRSLARRPDRSRFDALLSDPHPMVIRQLLGNPQLTEADAIRIATRRPARKEVLRELARVPRWLHRARVRQAILHNPGAPPDISVPMLGLCNRNELKELIGSTDSALVLRATAQEFLERRPPMTEPEEPPLIQ